MDYTTGLISLGVVTFIVISVYAWRRMKAERPVARKCSNCGFDQVKFVVEKEWEGESHGIPAIIKEGHWVCQRCGSPQWEDKLIEYMSEHSK
jgi:ribosomal protein L37E